MNWLVGFLTSNIGRKLVMALTGLFLVSFLFVHVSGNLLLLRSDDGYAFNVFSHFMSTNGLIHVLEYVLLFGFLIHIFTSLYLTRRNAAARPKGYVAGNKTPGVSWFSKNMGLTGSLVLIFLVIHIKTFWYTYHFQQVPRVYYNTVCDRFEEHTVVEKMAYTHGMELPEGVVDVYKDMQAVAFEAFHSPLYIALYLAAFLLLAFHLAHGFGSAFRTLGLEHKKYTPLVNVAGKIIAIVVPLGFAIIPLVVHYRGYQAIHHPKEATAPMSTPNHTQNTAVQEITKK